MKVGLFNQKGKELEKIELSDDIFGVKVNPKVISQYVFIYLSNQRESNAQTKDRSEVSGGGVKPWRQKGTGRARVGSSRSPIWRKGGVVFGPTNAANFKKKTTKNFRKNVMKSVLSMLAKENMLKVVDTLEVDSKAKLTKQAAEINKAFGSPKKMFIVTNDKNENLVKSFSNLKGQGVEMVKNINSYELMNGGLVLVEKSALEFLNTNLK